MKILKCHQTDMIGIQKYINWIKKLKKDMYLFKQDSKPHI